MDEARTYLDLAATRAGSNRAIAKRVDRSESFLSRVRSDLKPIPPLLAAQCASFEKLDPVAATLEALRDGSEASSERLFWSGVLADYMKAKRP